MMTPISEYPALSDALVRSGKIVYIYGAGMSMALGEHRLSWSNWLRSSEAWLDEQERAALQAMLDSDDADALVGAAGYVLRTLKAKNAYDAFMKDSVEALQPKQAELMAAVKLTIRAGDAIATTNYDQLIERAAGIGSVTYAHAGEILQILRGESVPRAIHLHGMYRSDAGIDDIIADETQYGQILENQAAQFIQNLIGTHTVIFVGCGATVSDPNLSRFISFAAKHLNLNIPYFYICRQNDSIPEMPPNVLPIVYGEDYADLPLFLLSLTSHRVRFRSGYEKLIGINPYLPSHRILAPYGRLHFTNRFHDFVGREDAMQALDGFAEAEEKCLWWAIIGDGGIGKSRLLLEWLRRLPSTWFGFFLRHGVLKEDETLVPFADTVVVIDYVMGHEEGCAEELQVLFSLFEKSPYRLRVVLLERHLELSAQNSWYVSLKKKMGSYRSIRFLDAAYRRPDHSAAEVDPLQLEPLCREEERRYVESYLRAYFLIDPEYAAKYEISQMTDEIVSGFHKSLPEKYDRPLFLSIYIEVWIDQDGRLAPTDISALLELYLHREEDRFLTSLGGDEEALGWYLRLLALASAIEIACVNSGDNGYLQADSEKLYERLHRGIRPGKNKPTWEELFLWDEPNRHAGEPNEPPEYMLLMPEYPDIIRAFAVSFYIPKEDAERFARAARGQSTFEFGLFLCRAIEDFPEEELFERMALTPPEDPLDEFEYYVPLLHSARELVGHREEIEAHLLQSQSQDALVCTCEMELWRRLAVVLADQPVQFAAHTERFSEYIQARRTSPHMIAMLPEVLEAYLVGFYNQQQKDGLASLLQTVIEQVEPDVGVATTCAEGLCRVAELRELSGEPLRIRKEVDGAALLASRFPENPDVLCSLSELTRKYVSHIQKQQLPQRISRVNRTLADAFWNSALQKEGDPETIRMIAGNLAVCLVNEYFAYHDTRRASSEERVYCEAGVRRLYREYEDVRDVRMAYASMISDQLMDIFPTPEIKKELLEKLRSWHLLYPEEIDFAESYGKALCCRYRFCKEHGDRRAAASALHALEQLAASAPYSVYREENQIEEILSMIKSGVI